MIIIMMMMINNKIGSSNNNYDNNDINSCNSNTAVVFYSIFALLYFDESCPFQIPVPLTRLIFDSPWNYKTKLMAGIAIIIAISNCHNDNDRSKGILLFHCHWLSSALYV